MYEDCPARLGLEQPSRDAVVAELRNGVFDFWRDLVPPFRIHSVRREPEISTMIHTYYSLDYSVAMDFKSERAIFRGKSSSTFDNTMVATALVRMPSRSKGDGIQVLSFGAPHLSGGDQGDQMKQERKLTKVKKPAAAMKKSESAPVMQAARVESSDSENGDVSLPKL